MKKYTFRYGGLNLNSSKLTAGLDVVKTHMPKLVRIPLSQHIGSPAKLMVSAGQIVTEGQVIGEANGIISANVHASVSGKVISIQKGEIYGRKNVDIVEIETGGTIRNWYENKHSYEGASKDSLLQDIKNAGVVGLGGAGFPAHFKLSPPADKKIETLIVNGAECEPYLTADHCLMMNKVSEILEGIKIVMKILSVNKAIIGIEENMAGAIALFTEKLQGNSSIVVMPFATKYPQGSEKQMIQAVTGKEVPSRGLPIDIGILVENVATIYAIYEAIVYKKPLIERIINYSGDGVKNCGNYKIRIGTPVSQLYEEFGIPEKHGTVLSGGPMMGIEITDHNFPLMKTTGGVVVLSRKKDYQVTSRPCIRCSKCLMVCPMRLQPTELAKLCDALEVEEAAGEMGLFDCIECGSCSYSCPSFIPIVGLIRYGKALWRHKQANK